MGNSLVSDFFFSLADSPCITFDSFIITCLGENLFLLNLFERFKNFMNLATRAVGALRGNSGPGLQAKAGGITGLSQWHTLGCGGWLQLLVWWQGQLQKAVQWQGTGQQKWLGPTGSA